MAKHPIKITLRPYRGRKETLRQKWLQKLELAHVVEAHINDTVRNSPNQTIVLNYATIAADLGQSTETIRDLLFDIDGGYTGITIQKE